MDVHVALIRPFEALRLNVPRSTTGAELQLDVAGAMHLNADDAALVRITTRGGRILHDADPVSLLGPSPVHVEVRVRQLGGKGGFGNMLRAQGGRMSARSKGNTDACRDLNGRRLSTLKEAQRLAEYLAKEPERQKALDEAQTRKYAKLEKMLGRQPKSAQDFEEAAAKLDEAGEELEESVASEAGPSRPAPKRKERIEDHEFVEQSRELVDNVRSAVATAMKKRKKKKAAPPGAGVDSAAGDVSAPTPSSAKGKGKAVEVDAM